MPKRRRTPSARRLAAHAHEAGFEEAVVGREVCHQCEVRGGHRGPHESLEQRVDVVDAVDPVLGRVEGVVARQLELALGVAVRPGLVRRYDSPGPHLAPEQLHGAVLGEWAAPGDLVEDVARVVDAHEHADLALAEAALALALVLLAGVFYAGV